MNREITSTTKKRNKINNKNETQNEHKPTNNIEQQTRSKERSQWHRTEIKKKQKNTSSDKNNREGTARRRGG